MAKQRRARQGRAYWTNVIAKFEGHGLSHEAFCKREKLNIGTFRAWLYRLRAEGGVGVPGFVEVVEQATPASQECVVRFGSVQVEFGKTPAAAYLAELLTTLESRPR